MSLKITPLAAESMGTRSMATFVESARTKILIDPAAGLAANRSGLAPHPVETWRLKKHRERIRLFADSAQAIVITCFHEDHCPDSLSEIVRGKMLFIRNPNVRLPVENRKRAFHLLKEIQGLPLDIVYMDNRTFELGDLRISFSKQLQSTDEEAGDTVIALAVSHEIETFLFSSNLEGIFNQQALQWMLHQKPTFMYLDGPLTFSSQHRKSRDQLDLFLKLMKKLFEEAPLHTLLFDHHITRDKDWRKKMEPLFKLAVSCRIKMMTAAEYRGETVDLLEARRTQLHGDEPLPS